MQKEHKTEDNQPHDALKTTLTPAGNLGNVRVGKNSTPLYYY